jgi:hypothetical protein
MVVVFCAIATPQAWLEVSRPRSQLCFPLASTIQAFFSIATCQCRKLHLCRSCLHGRQIRSVHCFRQLHICRWQRDHHQSDLKFLQFNKPMMRSQPRNNPLNDWLPTAYLVTENTCSSLPTDSRQRCARMMEGEEAAA